MEFNNNDRRDSRLLLDHSGRLRRALRVFGFWAVAALILLLVSSRASASIPSGDCTNVDGGHLQNPATVSQCQAALQTWCASRWPSPPNQPCGTITFTLSSGRYYYYSPAFNNVGVLSPGTPVTCVSPKVESEDHLSCIDPPIQCPAAGTPAGRRQYSLGSSPADLIAIDQCGARVSSVTVCLPQAGYCAANYTYTGNPATTAPPGPDPVVPPPTPYVSATPAPPPVRAPPTGFPYNETQTGGHTELDESLPSGTARSTVTTEPTRQTTVNQTISTDSVTNIVTTYTTTVTTYTGSSVTTNNYSVTSTGGVSTASQSNASPPTTATSSAVTVNGPAGTTSTCTGTDCSHNPAAPAGSGTGGNGDGTGEGTFSGPGGGQLYDPVYPNGFAGVLASHPSPTNPISTWMTGLRDSWPSGGSCPSWSVSLSGLPHMAGSQPLTIPCNIWAYVRSILLVCSLFAAWRILMGGR